MGRPLIFGEVLYDVFPDRQVLGGAPFNVAWHLQGFGAEPLFVSSVGDDDPGRRIKNAMADWGMDTAALQIHGRYPTGVVQVSIESGQPAYEIVPDQAYDFIEPLPDSLTAPVGLVYHGSLALRQPVSRDSFERSIRDQAAVFMDVNLRPPWWRWETLHQWLQQAAWIKLNDIELGEIAARLQRIAAAGDVAGQAQALRQHYGAEAVIMTRGEHGAMWIDQDGVIEQDTPRVADLVDTVGAGDAFSSVCIYGILRQWPQTLILGRALDFAADICRQPGATAANRQLYQQHLDTWRQRDERV